jgi:hypothetical protein
MENDPESFVERLSKASRMGQEPRDRLWSIVIVLAIVQLLLGGFLVETRLYLSEGRALSYERSAADCLDLIVDDDRDFSLPAICHNERVFVHYPPEVCETYFVADSTCSAEWE